MKELIIGCTILVLSFTLNVGMNDIRFAQREYKNLKFVADELSATGALFFDYVKYSNGKKVFNQLEAEKAIEDQLKDLLNLDDSYIPMPGGYWTDKVSYEVYFYDDLNTVYPYLFIDGETGFTYTIADPTVIVTINAGRPRYNLSVLQNDKDFIRSSAHVWEER